MELCCKTSARRKPADRDCIRVDRELSCENEKLIHKRFAAKVNKLAKLRRTSDFRVKKVWSQLTPPPAIGLALALALA